MSNRAIFWFRRDLRTDDNTGLFHAVNENDVVIPLFVLDNLFLDTVKQDNPRLGFLLDALKNLDIELRKLDSHLILIKGSTEQIIEELVSKHNIQSLYFNKAHSHKSIEQENKIKQLCKKLDIETKIFSDSLLVPVEQVDCRKVYTPFFKLWLKQLKEYKLLRINNIQSPKMNAISVDKIIADIKHRKNTHWPVNLFKSKLKEFDFCNYKETRNLPYMEGTSRMSPYIRFGLISIRRLFEFVNNLGCDDQTYISEIAWREFWYHIIHNFPESREIEFQSKRRGLEWFNNEQWIEAWKDGKTGYPLIDAGMRQLKEEGWIHNRVRMVVASFLTKDLITDWRFGDRHFYNYLIDYDANVDIGNWQWSASVGADPKPLRIFNPILQSKKFDPECRYIRKYVPELMKEETEKIHDPIKYKLNYYEPIVDHYEITHKTREIYKKAN